MRISEVSSTPETASGFLRYSLSWVTVRARYDRRVISLLLQLSARMMQEHVFEVGEPRSYRPGEAGIKELLNQGGRRIQCDDAPLVHDGDAITQELGFLHVVRGEHDG